MDLAMLPEVPHAPGLRERKKAKTRLAISKIATTMFIEHGFDAVTVAEVAAAADVSVATIFNYFDTKEDLFFDREGEIIEAHGRFIRGRAPGETIASALHRQFLLAMDAALPRLIGSGARFIRTIDASPALRARARFALEKAEAATAEAIAEETGARPGDPTPRVTAAMFIAIERMLVEEARTVVLQGQALGPAKRRLRRACDRAFELLEAGLRQYGRKPAERSRR
jgi:AcrR family transcriptional regulator